MSLRDSLGMIAAGEPDRFSVTFLHTIVKQAEAELRIVDAKVAGTCTCSAGDLPSPNQHATLCPRFGDALRSTYPEVDAFAARMRAELWANRHKGDHEGWRSMTLRQAWGEISWHVGKLAGALKAEDFNLVRELAADVANGAMMLDDILLVRGVTDMCRCGVAVREVSPGCAWHDLRTALTDGGAE